MKTSKFSQVANKKLREQGLLQLKTKEFTSVNDCFYFIIIISVISIYMISLLFICQIELALKYIIETITCIPLVSIGA